MKERVFEIAIGTSVIVIALVFAVFAWNMVYSNTDGENYELHVEFAKSGNLKRGDMVSIAGVNVGGIDKVYVDPETFMVKVAFHVKANLKLTKDSLAEVLQSGLMGGTFLAITPGSQKEKLLKNNDTLTNTKDNQTVEDVISHLVSGTLSK